MQRRGFTLIELVTALAVSAMIVSATLSAYLAASKSWERGRATSDQYQEARMALATIELYLRAALAPGMRFGLTFEGDDGTLAASPTADAPSEAAPPPQGEAADTLHFCSSAGMLELDKKQRIDLCEVAFTLTQDEGTPRPALYMERKTLPGMYAPIPQDVRRAVLAPHAVKFNVTYFDGTSWCDDWLYASVLPEAVEITLGVATEEDPKAPLVLTRLIALPAAEAFSEETTP